MPCVCRGLCRGAWTQRRPIGAEAGSSSSVTSSRWRCAPTTGGTRPCHRLLRARGEASPVRTGAFPVPLSGPSADLVDVDDANRPAGMEPVSGLCAGEAGCVPSRPGRIFRPRRNRARRARADQGLEIAWLADTVDAFFIHVQGAARLPMTDGSLMRVTYAAKSGQRFSGPWQELADPRRNPVRKTSPCSRSAPGSNATRSASTKSSGATAPTSSSRQVRCSDPALGPIAAAKVPLTAGRSIAVDRSAAHLRHAVLRRRTGIDRL